MGITDCVCLLVMLFFFDDVNPALLLANSFFNKLLEFWLVRLG